MSDLPIEEALPALKHALRAHTSAVLRAPPGAGKTTRVPLALLDEPWLAGRRIVLLEPRRVAARAAAHYMARSLGEAAGETVGYRMRFDTRVGRRTRVEVVTEGVLTRMLQADAGLEGVGAVIFDELHERSLHADLGLALCIEARSALREDLRLLAMSATLDETPVAALLGDAPVVTSEGRAHPVETRYLGRPVEGRLEPAVVRAIRAALAEEGGDVLVFLPGAAEIGRVEAELREPGLPPNVLVATLHGSLPLDAQERAIRPSPPGSRKVVLATSIAETSLTIEGVRVVIDCGLMRVPRFAPRTGMTRLETVPVTRASADQRRGRAGRLGPGVCYRLWTEHQQRSLLAHGTPEILQADLAPLALELAAWGAADPAALSWLDPPPPAALAHARELLAQLGALDGAGAITSHGRAMADLPLHPRLAHMALRARDLGLLELACDVAALLEERDFLRAEAGAPETDLRLRLDVLSAVSGGGARYAAAGHTVDLGAARRVAELARQWRRRLGAAGGAAHGDGAGLLLAHAYPDRIAQQRGKRGAFVLRNGAGAEVPGAEPIAGAPYLAVATLDGKKPVSRVFLAAPLTLEEIRVHFGEQIRREERVAWDPQAETVRARRRDTLGTLVLGDAPAPDPDPAEVADALLGAITAGGLEMLPWTPAARGVQQRVLTLRSLDAEWPDVSDPALLAGLGDWLRPRLHGLGSRADLQRLDLHEILLATLPWQRRAQLDALAPTHLTVPSGSRIPIDYSQAEAPALAVRLQEVFGMRETPRIANGAMPLTLHLLSPARRPVQVTRDLGSFWRAGYFEVRKDLKGRYPKHYWPDDPLAATPTHRTRPRE